jgi:hypothetical protein
MGRRGQGPMNRGHSLGVKEMMGMNMDRGMGEHGQGPKN